MEIKEINENEYVLVDGSLIVAVARKHGSGWLVTGGGTSWANSKKQAMDQLWKRAD